MTERRSPIPTPLRVTSEVCARLLVVAAAVALPIHLVILLRIVVIPVAISVLQAQLAGSFTSIERVLAGPPLNLSPDVLRALPVSAVDPRQAQPGPVLPPPGPIRLRLYLRGLRPRAEPAE